MERGGPGNLSIPMDSRERHRTGMTKYAMEVAWIAEQSSPVGATLAAEW